HFGGRLSPVYGSAGGVRRRAASRAAALNGYWCQVVRNSFAPSPARVLDRALSESTSQPDAQHGHQDPGDNGANEGRPDLPSFGRCDTSGRVERSDGGRAAMTSYATDLIIILPELIVIATACLVLVLDPLTPLSRKELLAWLSLGSLALCIGLTRGTIGGPQLPLSAFNDLVVVDGYARFWKLLLFGVTGLTILM